MVTMEMLKGVERDGAEIETLKKVGLFRFYFFSGIGGEKWHVFKKSRNCEICGESVKLGFARLFCFELTGIAYVANEADHARCARKLKVLMDFRRGGREGGG